MYQDLTSYTSAPYDIAEIIRKGYHPNIQYIEFHKHHNSKNPIYDSEALDNFREYSNDYYVDFICSPYPDEFEADIDIAIQIGQQWSIIRDCGSNFYFGYGPQGIIELRKACTEKGIAKTIINEPLSIWLNNKFHQNETTPRINYISSELGKFSEKDNILGEL